MREIREGLLCAPLGEPSKAKVGGFYLQMRPDVAASDVVNAFVGWLKSEVRRDGRLSLSPAATGQRRMRRARQRAPGEQVPAS